MSVADALIQAALLGEAVDSGPASVFVTDENGRYVAVNRTACDLLGYEREELLALSLDDVAQHSPSWQELLESGTRRSTVELVRKDGSRVSFTYTAGGANVAGMPVFVSVGCAELADLDAGA